MGIIIDIKERIKISINLLSEGLYEKESIIGMALLWCVWQKCIISGTEPDINRQLLNEAGIYILGNRGLF